MIYLPKKASNPNDRKPIVFKKLEFIFLLLFIQQKIKAKIFENFSGGQMLVHTPGPYLQAHDFRPTPPSPPNRLYIDYI